MKKVGRLVFKPANIFWGVEKMSFAVYKNKGEYLVKIWEKQKGRKIPFYWGARKWGLADMMSIINQSERKNGKGRITINTLPKEVMDRANKELILEKLK